MSARKSILSTLAASANQAVERVIAFALPDALPHEQEQLADILLEPHANYVTPIRRALDTGNELLVLNAWNKSHKQGDSQDGRNPGHRHLLYVAQRIPLGCPFGARRAADLGQSADDSARDRADDHIDVHHRRSGARNRDCRIGRRSQIMRGVRANSG